MECGAGCRIKEVQSNGIEGDMDKCLACRTVGGRDLRDQFVRAGAEVEERIVAEIFRHFDCGAQSPWCIRSCQCDIRWPNSDQHRLAFGRAAGEAIGQGRVTASACSFPPIRRAGTRFMAGLPMNVATKVLAGRV